MEISELTLNDKDLIQENLDSIGMYISEFSFPNLYLFRKTHGYQKILVGRELFITGLTYDKKRYIMPMHRPDKTSQAACFSTLKILLNSNNWDFIFPIPKEWLECFDPNLFSWCSSPDDSDYLYLTEKMKNYPGKKMHKKKNLLNQFRNKYNTEFIPLEKNNISKAREILVTWEHASRQELATSDYQPCLEALEQSEKLNLTSRLAVANGKIAGFLIGEELNPETFTIHFAKADLQYKGVYQYMFSQFCIDVCPEHKYINMEQDLGKPGLRKTKQSYRPELIAEKNRVKLA